MKKSLIIFGIIFLFIIILRLLFFSGPALPRSSLPSRKIIDIHVHAAGLGAGNSGCYISEALKNSYKYAAYLRAFGLTEQNVLENGDGLIIKKISDELNHSKYVKAAVILALDGAVNSAGELDYEKTEVYIPNSFVAHEVTKYKNLLFGASINPYRKNALELLRQAKKEHAVLIKWIPSIQHIDPSDNRLIPFYKLMQELGLLLLTHTGQERSFTIAVDAFADPAKLILPLELGVTVIAAHVATTGKNENQNNSDRILPLLKKYPNLYADISSLTQINKLGHLSQILKHGNVTDKLIYGTDMPLINTALVSPVYFPLNLSIKDMVRLLKITNPWDQDVALKQALGVPTEVFLRTEQILMN